MSELILTIDKIVLQGMSFGYKGDQLIFDDISFTMPMNHIVWVAGATGCGKSAFLKLLMGLEMPQTGKILMDGKNISDLSFEELLPYRLNIGYSFDLGGLLNNKTLRDNLKLPLMYHNQLEPKVVEDRVDEYLDKFQLTAHQNSRPAEVSGGIRKAVCLVRAFIMEPRMVLLDDPSTGLGTEMRKTLREHIRAKMEQGQLKHVYIASDDRRFLDGFSDSKLVLTHGQFAMAS